MQPVNIADESYRLAALADNGVKFPGHRAAGQGFVRH